MSKGVMVRGCVDFHGHTEIIIESGGRHIEYVLKLSISLLIYFCMNRSSDTQEASFNVCFSLTRCICKHAYIHERNCVFTVINSLY